MSVEKRAIQFGSRVAKLSDGKAKLSRQAAGGTASSMRRGGGTTLYKV
jgi:hypothetical protein